jgi:hypothetical protein
VPERQERGRTAIHHERRRFLGQESLQQGVESALVNAVMFVAKMEPIGTQRRVLSKRAIHGISVDASDLFAVVPEVLGKDGSDQALPHASLALQR